MPNTQQQEVTARVFGLIPKDLLEGDRTTWIKLINNHSSQAVTTAVTLLWIYKIDDNKNYEEVFLNIKNQPEVWKKIDEWVQRGAVKRGFLKNKNGEYSPETLTIEKFRELSVTIHDAHPAFFAPILPPIMPAEVNISIDEIKIDIKLLKAKNKSFVNKGLAEFKSSRDEIRRYLRPLVDSLLKLNNPTQCQLYRPAIREILIEIQEKLGDESPQILSSIVERLEGSKPLSEKEFQFLQQLFHYYVDHGCGWRLIYWTLCQRGSNVQVYKFVDKHKVEIVTKAAEINADLIGFIEKQGVIHFVINPKEPLGFERLSPGYQLKTTEEEHKMEVERARIAALQAHEDLEGMDFSTAILNIPGKPEEKKEETPCQQPDEKKQETPCQQLFEKLKKHFDLTISQDQFEIKANKIINTPSFERKSEGDQHLLRLKSKVLHAIIVFCLEQIDPDQSSPDEILAKVSALRGRYEKSPTEYIGWTAFVGLIAEIDLYVKTYGRFACTIGNEPLVPFDKNDPIKDASGNIHEAFISSGGDFIVKLVSNKTIRDKIFANQIKNVADDGESSITVSANEYLLTAEVNRQNLQKSNKRFSISPSLLKNIQDNLKPEIYAYDLAFQHKHPFNLKTAQKEEKQAESRFTDICTLSPELIQCFLNLYFSLPADEKNPSNPRDEIPSADRDKEHDELAGKTSSILHKDFKTALSKIDQLIQRHKKNPQNNVDLKPLIEFIDKIDAYIKEHGEFVFGTGANTTKMVQVGELNRSSHGIPQPSFMATSGRNVAALLISDGRQVAPFIAHLIANENAKSSKTKEDEGNVIPTKIFARTFDPDIREEEIIRVIVTPTGNVFLETLALRGQLIPLDHPVCEQILKEYEGYFTDELQGILITKNQLEQYPPNVRATAVKIGDKYFFPAIYEFCNGKRLEFNPILLSGKSYTSDLDIKKPAVNEGKLTIVKLTIAGRLAAILSHKPGLLKNLQLSQPNANPVADLKTSHELDEKKSADAKDKSSVSLRSLHPSVREVKGPNDQALIQIKVKCPENQMFVAIALHELLSTSSNETSFERQATINRIFKRAFTSSTLEGDFFSHSVDAPSYISKALANYNGDPADRLFAKAAFTFSLVEQINKYFLVSVIHELSNHSHKYKEIFQKSSSDVLGSFEGAWSIYLRAKQDPKEKWLGDDEILLQALSEIIQKRIVLLENNEDRTKINRVHKQVGEQYKTDGTIYLSYKCNAGQGEACFFLPPATLEKAGLTLSKPKIASSSKPALHSSVKSVQQSENNKPFVELVVPDDKNHLYAIALCELLVALSKGNEEIRSAFKRLFNVADGLIPQLQKNLFQYNGDPSFFNSSMGLPFKALILKFKERLKQHGSQQENASRKILEQKQVEEDVNELKFASTLLEKTIIILDSNTKEIAQYGKDYSANGVIYLSCIYKNDKNIYQPLIPADILLSRFQFASEDKNISEGGALTAQRNLVEKTSSARALERLQRTRELKVMPTAVETNVIFLSEKQIKVEADLRGTNFLNPIVLYELISALGDSDSNVFHTTFITLFGEQPKEEEELKVLLKDQYDGKRDFIHSNDLFRRLLETFRVKVITCLGDNKEEYTQFLWEFMRNGKNIMILQWQKTKLEKDLKGYLEEKDRKYESKNKKLKAGALYLDRLIKETENSITSLQEIERLFSSSDFEEVKLRIEKYLESIKDSPSWEFNPASLEMSLLLLAINTLLEKQVCIFSFLNSRYKFFAHGEGWQLPPTKEKDINYDQCGFPLLPLEFIDQSEPIQHFIINPDNKNIIPVIYNEDLYSHCIIKSKVLKAAGLKAGYEEKEDPEARARYISRLIEKMYEVEYFVTGNGAAPTSSQEVFGGGEVFEGGPLLLTAPKPEGPRM